MTQDRGLRRRGWTGFAALGACCAAVAAGLGGALLASGDESSPPVPGRPQAVAPQVQVYFSNPRLQTDETSCTETFALPRTIPHGLSVHERLAAALSALLEGPRPEERRAGYRSWFSPTTAGRLAEARVLPHVVRVDFSDFTVDISGASSSCGSAALLAALDATVHGVVGPRPVAYSFAGDCAPFYEWLQRAAPAC